ncbi:MAG: sugar nucleotide-binding protein [Alphaproteobacteria bacterium]|nr:sugar nucleotide-binding protein [Alphaproteobacteria bacterium]
MYLIVGASGFLGRYCIKNVLEKTDEKIIATYSNSLPNCDANNRVDWKLLNITDADAVNDLAKSVDNDTKIIYLAAYHHPDKVQENPEYAWNINITALANAVNAFHNAKCLYYSSTDTVYGEGHKDKKFTETDKCAPVNTYGRQKVLAEQITLAKNFNVVRFPFIFGPSLVPNRPHFFDKIRADMESGKTVEMFDDSYRSTLSFNQCAGFLIDIIEKFGTCDEHVLNIAADKGMSKYDAAIALANKYGLDTKLIKPISVKTANGIFTAKRAETAILDNTKIKQLLNLKTIQLEL